MLPTPAPYRGLTPFDEADAAFFFGRDRDVRRIVNQLFLSPLVVLYGANGVGKSSVVRAGVVRNMNEREDHIVVRFSAWAYDPLTGLKTAICEAVKRATRRQFDPSQISLADLLSQSVTESDQRFLIVLDQFEEFFLYHNYRESGVLFATEFATAVWRKDLPVGFLVSVREDSLGKLDYFQETIPQFLDSRLRLEYMDRAAAREAILQPLAVYNNLAESGPSFSIDDELVEAVLDQITTGYIAVDDSTGRFGQSMRAGERIEVPFLQLVMLKLWETELARGSNVLRLRTLEDLGGAEKIVRGHLDSALAELSPAGRNAAASIARFLVTPSGSKITQEAQSLAAWSNVPAAQVADVLGKLAKSRIVRTVPPPPGESEPRYEIFHDVLGPALLDWRQRHETDKAMRLRVRRLTLVATSLLALLMLMSLFTSYAMKQRAEAMRQSAEAERQRGVAEAQRKIAEEYAEMSKRQADQLEQIAHEERQRAEMSEAQRRAAQAQAKKIAAQALRKKNE